MPRVQSRPDVKVSEACERREVSRSACRGRVPDRSTRSSDRRSASPTPARLVAEPEKHPPFRSPLSSARSWRKSAGRTLRTGQDISEILLGALLLSQCGPSGASAHRTIGRRFGEKREAGWRRWIKPEKAARLPISRAPGWGSRAGSPVVCRHRYLPGFPRR